MMCYMTYRLDESNMADTSDGSVPPSVARIELTDEEKTVLKECTRNSVFFRGFPAGIVSVVLLSQAVKSGYFPQVKRFAGMVYTGLFGFAFYAGVRSYTSTCIEKIMKLENSQLKDSIVKNMHKRAGKGMLYDENSGQSISEQNDLSSPRDIRFSTQDESPLTDDHAPLPSSIATSGAEDRSSEDVRAPPSLYFDVEEAKENKYKSYEELRKKHRERWTPPSPSRMEQPRHRREGEQDSRTGSRDASPSWFDQDNSSDETGQQRNSQRERPSYRQGPPPKKNKYGDLME
ncbi:hypothetical protein ACROYT_G020090 [Oculina patagonica]